MKLLKGIRLGHLQAQVVLALQVAEPIWIKNGADELYVTSLHDGVHSDRSSHYRGHGVDLRVQDPTFGSITVGGMTSGTIGGGLESGEGIAQQLARALGPDFQVYFERDHVHLEWSPLPADLPPDEYLKRWNAL